MSRTRSSHAIAVTASRVHCDILQVVATSAPDSPKVGVVVLGMGRSGTSSVTRMFASAGFFVGEENELMPANEANPTGHWERLGVWRANERILEELGASWFDPPSAASQLAVQEWAVPLLQAEVDRFVRESQGAPVALKDPRINVMMPLWGQIVRTSFHPVVVVRDPFEIALSLQRRDGTPTAFGLSAWELHMTSLLNELSGRIVTVAPYAQLIDDEELARSMVEAAIHEVDPARSQHVRADRACKAFEQRLRRNRASPTDHYQHLTTRQLELWRYLSSLPKGNQIINAPEQLLEPSNAAHEAVRRETERIADIHERAGLIRGLATEREQISLLATSLATEQEQRDRFSAEMQTVCDELRTEQDRARAAVDAHARAEHWLSAIQHSLSWRVTEPLRAANRALRRG